MVKRLQWAALWAGAALVATSAGAGNLDPSGSPAPSMVTLDDLAAGQSALGGTQDDILAGQSPATPIDSLPFVITEPGSYRVTQNLTGIPASNGILILAHNVTLDLGGFTLVGVPGSLSGIVASPERIGMVSRAQQDIVIRNGQVRDWGGRGIDTLQTLGTVISDITAVENESFGVAGGLGSLVQRCVATDNAAGVVAFVGSTISQCTAISNEAIGIGAGVHTWVDQSVALGNRLAGIVAGDDAIVTDCIASENEGLSGGGVGIECSNRVTVRGCTANGNGDHGITVDDDCFVVGNTALENDADNDGTGAGIRVGGQGNRIDGNLCNGNELGIDVPGSDNHVVRNWARGNNGTGSPSADFNLSAGGNQVGPIYTTTGYIVTTNPWANFTL